jgi:hypothetical protein
MRIAVPKEIRADERRAALVMELIPCISRAQSMDLLTSQAVRRREPEGLMAHESAMWCSQPRKCPARGRHCS